MKKHYLIISLLMHLLCLTSCMSNSYTTWDKNKQIKKHSFALNNDSLTISDVVIGSYYVKQSWKNITEEAVSQDSVFQVFKQSLTLLGLPLKFNESITFHYATKATKETKYESRSLLTDEFIQSIVQNSTERYLIIPIIRTFTVDLTLIGFTTSGTPAGGLRRSGMSNIVIYLFDQKELKYLSWYNFLSEQKDIYYDNQGNAMNYFTDQPYVSPIQQKHWDKLIAKTMKDFIKRIKDEEKK